MRDQGRVQVQVQVQIWVRLSEEGAARPAIATTRQTPSCIHQFPCSGHKNVLRFKNERPGILYRSAVPFIAWPSLFNQYLTLKRADGPDSSFGILGSCGSWDKDKNSNWFKTRTPIQKQQDIIMSFAVKCIVFYHGFLGRRCER